MYDDLTSQIIGCAFEVHKILGSGFVEKVYENAMILELREKGLNAEQQHNIMVYYKGKKYGNTGIRGVYRARWQSVV